MVKTTEAVFEKKDKNEVALKLELEKASPGDKVEVIVNGEALGSYEEGQSVTLDPGDKVNLNPIPGEDSYFSFFEGMDPPKVLRANETVKVVFKSNGQG